MVGSSLAAVFAVAAVVGAAAAVAAWRRRAGHPAAAALALMMAGSAAWSGADALLQADLPLELRRSLLVPALLAGVCGFVVGLCGLPRLLADPTWRPSRRLGWLLLVEPLSIVVTAALPQTAGLVYDQVSLSAPAGDVRLAGGPLFAVHSV